MAHRVRRSRSWLLLLACLAAVAAAPAPALAQRDNGPAVPNEPFGDGILFNSNISGFSAPRIPPQGIWAEVIMANAKWVVVQNEQGQQFPIAGDSVRTFMVRWPMDLAAVSPEMLVEATGAQVILGTILTDHLDVYAGSARSLVTPSAMTMNGFNPLLSPVGIGFQNVYGDINPMVAGEWGEPNRLHVVGALLGLGPVRIAGGPNMQIVLLPPTPAGFSVTQVTLGSPQFARKGDLAYVVPAGATPRSLTLAQLILYKPMPLVQFAP